VVAAGGKRSRITHARKPQNQAETVAVGCDRLPSAGHGKEGVDGSSPSESSAKTAELGRFFGRCHLQELQCAVGMEPFLELSGSRTAAANDTFGPVPVQ
jgi:hypothetical protein